ncbi:MAG: Ldh family oxidoreductase [Methylobacter sp.]
MKTISLAVEEFQALATRALVSRGTPPESAALVIDALLKAECMNYRSHGIFRLADYLQEIDQGLLDPLAHPVKERLGENVWRVDGKRGFGQLSAVAVAELLCREETDGVKTVTLVNSRHVGRLADIVSMAAGNALVLGCCNYMGHGQRVAPPGGAVGKLCTNPIILAVPCKDRPPIVLDMTTSHVAEGKVRERWLAGESLQERWLIDERGDMVSDPAALYADPPSAFMAPLGGDMEHKGFGLALFVEIIAGIMTGGGFCGTPASAPGNAGVFMSIPLDILGQSSSDVRCNIQHLMNEIQAAGPNVRIPGWREPTKISRLEVPATLCDLLSRRNGSSS